MFSWLRSRNQEAATARELYGSVVAAARNPDLYRECGVPDTPEGRYEMVVLHLALALSRLKDLGGNGRDLARRTVEAFVVDMDDAFREMGVGDLGVPKKVKRAAAGLYERTGIYDEAAAAGEAALRAALAASVPGLAGNEAGTARLAQAVLRSQQALRRQPAEAILSGKLVFQDA